MKLSFKTISITLSVAALSACSQPSSTNNQTAEAVPVEEMPMDEGAAGNMAMNDPADPYAAPMARMSEQMMAAQGAHLSETFARKMLPHHAGAIEMSNVLISQGGDEKFLAKARKTIEDMQKDSRELERLLQAGLTGGAAAGNPFEPAMTKMQQAMMSASGSTPGETWARKMIAHHQGAVDMSEIMLKQGGDPKILENARKTADMQKKEIADLQKMLPA